MNPVEWAIKTAEVQGWEKAYSICVTTGREYFKPGIRNPQFRFYNQARIWLMANSPVDLTKVVIEVPKRDNPRPRSTEQSA